MVKVLKVHREVRSVNQYNLTSKSGKVKYTVDIPFDTYTEITRICKERRIPRSIWFRDAINRAFHTSYTTKQLIDYEIMRRLGDFSPMKPPEKVTTSSARTSHGFHKYPGFISGLQKNSFVYNLFRREIDDKEM
jgi:hypothetical protein